MHIAIILDGNRRYAKKNAWKPWRGHESGADTFEKLLDWCKELEIKELTLYALSIENLKREKEELDHLLEIIKKEFTKFKEDQRIKKNKVKIRFIGNLSLLPKDLELLCEEIQEETKENDNYTINFCIAYGGRQEILSAIEKLKKEKKEINEKNLEQALWIKKEPDIIIRTGSRLRTSNFLPWQSIYSEWFFLDKLWPEFTKQDLESCIKEFQKRQRNFGK